MALFATEIINRLYSANFSVVTAVTDIVLLLPSPIQNVLLSELSNRSCKFCKKKRREMTGLSTQLLPVWLLANRKQNRTELTNNQTTDPFYLVILQV